MTTTAWQCMVEREGAAYEELQEELREVGEKKPGVAIALAIAYLGYGVVGLRNELRMLGNGDADADGKGAVEAFGMHMGEKLENAASKIASALQGMSSAIDDLDVTMDERLKAIADRVTAASIGN